MRGASRSDSEPEGYRQLRGELIRILDRSPTLPRLLATQGYLSHQSAGGLHTRHDERVSAVWGASW
jgi:hypothetical protein